MSYFQVVEFTCKFGDVICPRIFAFVGSNWSIQIKPNISADFRISRPKPEFLRQIFLADHIPEFLRQWQMGAIVMYTAKSPVQGCGIHLKPCPPLWCTSQALSANRAT